MGQLKLLFNQVTSLLQSFYIGRPPILAGTYMDSNTELGEGIDSEHQNGAECMPVPPRFMDPLT